ncbi:LacI family DNA-binding transcriptional regulator [Kutzneria buriramensis]|uniref:LacI family transcriptional regulator n=1 Tax=Kutzneria buriramensis TaxID=1045776 RepID=A0A3E0GSU6_9PSEU|nr:LacI family DNA-binding transcriptional regulator [Kutzneria buriramensis]REH26203.1 LacI family transcriptional regulator [Kutzneria buriramensis]
MRRVGIKDVARLAGVSVGTVSHVLNRPEVVAATTRQRVEQAIGELGFVRNSAAGTLRAGRSKVLGLVVMDVTNPFYTDIARGAEDVAQVNGYVVILGNSDESDDKESNYLRVLQEQQVAGVLITPVHDDSTRLRQLRDVGTSVVLVDRPAQGVDQCSVAVDNVAGGRLAAEHLLGLGHDEITFVTGPAAIRQCADRRAGVKAALRAAGIPAATGLREFVVPAMNTASGRAAGEKLVQGKRRPRAIFCANDLLAVGVLHVLLRAGVRVPEDVMIVGYDDITSAESAAIPLTTVRQPTYQMGHMAAELMIAECEQPQHHAHQQILFQPTLVVRSTTKASPPR